MNDDVFLCFFFQFDAEIVFLEGKEREKQRQLDFLTQEIITVTNMSKSNQEQVDDIKFTYFNEKIRFSLFNGIVFELFSNFQMQALGYVENESEIVKQQEENLQSEIALIRSKLANCETELLQCKNKIR